MDQAMIETPGKLSQLAEIAVRIGVNVQRDQELIINAPVEAVPLVRALARHAYRAGARDVLVNYTDQNLARIQLTEGADPIFDHAPAWRYNGITRALQDGAAILTIAGSDPNLLAGCDGGARDARHDRRFQGQLVDHLLRPPRLGAGGVPASARERSGRAALVGDFRGKPHRRGGRGRQLGGPCRPAPRARQKTEREPVRRPAPARPGD
jgi:hypothetical protein